jgi:hypothetical protein
MSLMLASTISGVVLTDAQPAAAAPWCNAFVSYRTVSGGCEIEPRWTNVRMVVVCKADALNWVFTRRSNWSGWLYYQSWGTTVSCGTTARPVRVSFDISYG